MLVMLSKGANKVSGAIPTEFAQATSLEYMFIGMYWLERKKISFLSVAFDF